MRHLTRWIVAATALAGATATIDAASAAAAGPGALAAAAAAPVEFAQYWGGPYYGPPRPYPPRPYGYYGYGRPYYRGYGPPVVCRFRPTPWGPRRVCFRRY